MSKHDTPQRLTRQQIEQWRQDLMDGNEDPSDSYISEANALCDMALQTLSKKAPNPPDAGAWSGNADGLTALLIERDALARQVNDLLAELRQAKSATEEREIRDDECWQIIHDLDAEGKASSLIGFPVDDPMRGTIREWLQKRVRDRRDR